MIIPVGKRLLLEPIKEEKKTDSGLIIKKDIETREAEKAIVIKGSSDQIKEGDTVIYARYAPDEIEVDGKEYLIADPDTDILAIIS